MHLEEFLDGSKHCTELEPKLRRLNGMLYKISPFLSNSELLSFYHATFASSLLYGCQIWGLTTRTTLRKLETLQNSAIRIIARNDLPSNSEYVVNHVTPHFKSLKVLKLRDCITIKNTLLAYDFVNSNPPNSFHHFFTLQTTRSSINTRNSSKGSLFLNHVNSKKYGKNSIKHMAMLAWNDLIANYPKTNLKNMSRNGLKTLIKKSILNTY